MKLHQVGNCEVLFGVFAVAVGFLDDFAELRQIPIKATALYAENFILAAKKCGRAEVSAKPFDGGIVRIAVDPRIAGDPRIAVVGEVVSLLNKSAKFSLLDVAKSDESLNAEQLLPKNIRYKFGGQFKFFYGWIPP